MKIIALDVDGVLLDFMPDFDKAAEIVLGYKPQIHQDENRMDYYHLANRINVSPEKIDEILEYMQTSRMYASLKAFNGVKEAIKKIKKAGFKIYIVTALPEHAKEMRLENLKKELDLVPEKIYCVGMGMSKADALIELKPDVFIDDRIDYLANAKFVNHLVWIDQKEVQKDKESLVDVHVHSLVEWVEKYLPTVSKKLDNYYENKEPMQMDLKLENVKRKYNI